MRRRQHNCCWVSFVSELLPHLAHTRCVFSLFICVYRVLFLTEGIRGIRRRWSIASHPPGSLSQALDTPCPLCPGTEGRHWWQLHGSRLCRPQRPRSLASRSAWGSPAKRRQANEQGPASSKRVGGTGANCWSKTAIYLLINWCILSQTCFISTRIIVRKS